MGYLRRGGGIGGGGWGVDGDRGLSGLAPA